METRKWNAPSIDKDGFAITYLNHSETLTFDIQNLIQSSVGAGYEYSLSVLSKLFTTFMRYHGNNIWSDECMKERTNGTSGQPKNIMPFTNTVRW